MQHIDILMGDITLSPADAIVNASDNVLSGGGGVDLAIHRAAGPRLREACRALGGVATGAAVATPGFDLPCRYVLHTAGPRWQGGGQGEAAQLAACYRSCLELALSLGCRSVDFPSISTGVFGYPLSRAAHVALKAMMDFLWERPDCQLRLRMLCHSPEALRAYQLDWHMFYQEYKPRH